MKSAPFFIFILCLIVHILAPPQARTAVDEHSLRETIETLSSFGSRATGSPGYEKAAAFLEQKLEGLGLEPQSYLYELPVRRFLGAELSFDNRKISLTPFTNNAVTPEATDGIITAPLYYVGKGRLEDLDGKDIAGSIALLDFDSGRNWQLLASLGAKAAIFLQGDNSQGRIFFTEKQELTPLQFPCFWMKKGEAENIFGPLKDQNTPLIPTVALQSRIVWENYSARNLYALIEGTDPELSKELLIIEAFFDDEEFVSGNSPGADSATSIATFLEIAQSLIKDPPARSIMLIATSGQAQTLAGMRDIIWSINARSKDIRDRKRQLQKEMNRGKFNLELLQSLTFPLPDDEKKESFIGEAIKNSLEHAVDQVSRELMQLRLQEQTDEIKQSIKHLARQRLLYRRLGWAESFNDLPEGEAELFRQIIPKAIDRNERHHRRCRSVSSRRCSRPQPFGTMYGTTKWRQSSVSISPVTGMVSALFIAAGSTTSNRP